MYSRFGCHHSDILSIVIEAYVLLYSGIVYTCVIMCFSINNLYIVVISQLAASDI